LATALAVPPGPETGVWIAGRKIDNAGQIVGPDVTIYTEDLRNRDTGRIGGSDAQESSAPVTITTLYTQILGTEGVQLSARVTNLGVDARFDAHVNSDVAGATNPGPSYGHFDLLWEGTTEMERSRDDDGDVRQEAGGRWALLH
jgi:hypothetical protein